MKTPQFSNNVLPILVGMTRLPELADHRILIRHVIDDIESGEFSRAVTTLERAHAVFELSSLNDLRRFINNHGDAIALEVNTKPWRDVVSLINQPVQSWLRLTEGVEAGQLLKNCRSLTPVESVPAEAFYEHPIEYNVEPAMVIPPLRATDPPRVERHVQTPAQRNTVPQPVRRRINLMVAAATFAVTLLLAMVLGWLLK